MGKLSVIAGLAMTLAACSTSPQGKYEKAIADYVQTDKRGTWTDLQFEVVALETSEVTVADSLEAMRSEFEAQRTAAIENEKKNRQYWLDILTGNPQSREAGRYNENIEAIESRIDSLKNVSPKYVIRYDGLAPDEVLAIRAVCRYSYIMPGMDTRQERTDTFILSTDGKQVFGKEKTGD